MNNLIKCSLVRSLRTLCQALVMTLPAGTVITPALIQSFDWSFLFVILAWLLNAMLIAFGTFLTCIVGGIPEADEIDDDLIFDEEDGEVEDLEEDEEDEY